MANDNSHRRHDRGEEVGLSAACSGAIGFPNAVKHTTAFLAAIATDRMNI